MGRAGRARGLPAGLRHLGECLAGHGRLLRLNRPLVAVNRLAAVVELVTQVVDEGGREGRAREFYETVASLGSEG